MFPKQPDVYQHRYQLLDPKTNICLTNHLEIHMIELPKFRVQKELQPKTPLEAGLSFLKEGQKMSIVDLSQFNDPEIIESYKKLEILSLDPSMRAQYEAELKWVRDYRGRLSHDLRKAKKEGFEEGIEQGIQQGLEQSIEQGIEQGQRKVLQKTLRSFAKQRFPKMADSSLQPIEKLSTKALEELLEHILTYKNVRSFRQAMAQLKTK